MIFPRTNRRFSISGSRRLVALACWCALCVFAFPVFAQQTMDNDEVTLHLKWRHGFQFAGYYAALEQGFYEDEGLDVLIREAGPGKTSVEALLSGRAEYAVLGEQVLVRRLEGEPLVVLATIFQHNPYVIMSRADSGIRVPSDLVGKVVEANDAARPILDAMLLREGVDPGLVHVIPNSWGIADLIEGLSDAVACYITHEPSLMRSAGVDPALIHPINYGIDFYGDSLCVTERELGANPARVAAVRRASLRGWEYAMAHVDEMVGLILEMPGVVDRGGTREHLLYEAEQMRRLILPGLVEVGNINPGRWQRMADTYVDLGLAEPDYSLEGFVYESGADRRSRWLLLVQGLAVGVLVLSLLAYLWIRQLRRAVSSRTREARESVGRLRTLWDGLDDAVFVHDLRGSILDCNRAACERLAYTREDLLEMNVQEIDADEFAGGFEERLQRQLQHGGLRCEGVHCTGDGREIPVDINTTIIDYHDQKAVLAIMRDITDRREAERRLREEQDYSTALVVSAPTVIFGVGADGVCRFMNPAGETVTGYPADEVVGKNWWHLMYPGQLRAEVECLFDAFEAGPVSHYEMTLRRKDGETRIVAWDWRERLDDAGQQVELIGFGHDVTARHRAEQATRQSEQRLRAIVDLSPLGALFYRYQQDGSLVLEGANAATERILHVDVSPLIGKPIEEAFPDLKDTEIPTAYVRVAQTGEPFHMESFQYERGRISGCFEIHAFQIGENRMAVQFQDITERKRAEEERVRLEEQYRQAQKMEAVGQLTGGVAHDFNNLLQVINGAADLALADLDEKHPAHESLEAVIEAGQRAAQLVSQLLLFSRRQIMRPEFLDLNDVVTNLLKLLERVIGEHVRLQWEPGKRVGGMHGDRNMIEQTLVNLCVNARDAMTDVGMIRISTARKETDAEFCAVHSDARPGTYVCLSVADDGCGMDADTLARIFEPFFTTKEQGKGTGLGLATVYGIVRQHEGVITVDSEPGRGTSFEIYWPEVPETPEGVREAETVTMTVGGDETVLIAEDDSMVLSVARTVLERAGYHVRTAANGAEAVAIFEKYADDVNLLLFDVMMPVMGGREAYERIRAMRPDIRTIFASGYSEDAIHTNFVLERGLTLIQKPFLPTELLQAVRTKLDQRRR